MKGGADRGKWRGGEDVKLCVGGGREEDRTLAYADTLSNVGRARAKLSAWLSERRKQGGRGGGEKRFE